MANRVKTIRVPFATRITSLATNTTLGTATRHDFAAVTVNMPETTRTIRHVKVETTARDQFGVATDWDGVRVGIKINAVAFDDVDYTGSWGNTGDHGVLPQTRDVTSYFVTNDPGTATFTCQVGVAYATSVASNVTGITCVLIITYQYDDTASTHVKTIGYPIQSHHTIISTTYVEVGTIGGVSNAPANQILQLESGGLLPESSISIKDYWIDIFAMDQGAGTDLTLTCRFDGSTDNVRYVCTQTLSSNVQYLDRISLMGLSTTAAHAFEAKSDVASRFEHVGGIVWVTYTYSPGSSAAILNSLIVPLDNAGTNHYTLPDSTAGDAERWQAIVDIQEPTTITMKQSGVVLFGGFNNSTRNVLAPGQTARAYAYGSNLVRDAGEPLVHRCDHSSSTWSLSRGLNRLTVDSYHSVENIATTFPRGGFAIINYTSGKSPSGVGAHAHTTVWALRDMTPSLSTRDTQTPTAPNIPETSFKLFGSFADVWIHSTNILGVIISAERASGEGPGGGWSTANIPHTSTTDAELGFKRQISSMTHLWRQSYGVGESDPEKMNIETSRDWVNQGFLISANIPLGLSHYLTYHANEFTVAGNVEVNGSAVANGKTVEIIAKDSNGITERIGTTTTTGGTGAFTLEVLDNTRDYRALYEDGSIVGASAWNTPENETFDIEILTGGNDGAVLNSITGGTSRWDPVVANVTLNSDKLYLRYFSGNLKFMIYDQDEGFTAGFELLSTVTVNGSTRVFSIIPNGGWATNEFKLKFLVGAVL